VDGFNPINSSTVIEQFVESVLQKYKPVTPFEAPSIIAIRLTFSPRWLSKCVGGIYFLVEYSELYDWTRNYFDHLGQEHDLSKLIGHFVQNKVFAHEGNSVFFRYNIFLSFFIAHRIQQSQAFREWLLESHRYTDTFQRLIFTAVFLAVTPQ